MIYGRGSKSRDLFDTFLETTVARRTLIPAFSLYEREKEVIARRITDP